MMYRHTLWMLPALVFAGLPACTAEKTAMMKGEDVQPKVEEAAAVPVPAVTLPGYASTEHLQTVYFDLGSSRVTPAALEVLKKNADWLQQNPPFLVKVIGVSDSRGSDKHNKTLAERRAARVKDAYAEFGIPKERISLLGLGVDSTSGNDLSEEKLSQSRRVETQIEQKALASK